MVVLQAAGAAVADAAPEPLESAPLLAAGVGLALLWEISPIRQHCVNRHHAHPVIAVRGRPADRSVLGFGLAHACWCLATCWPVMMLPALSGRWHLAVMLIASLWMWKSMIDQPGRHRWALRLPWWIGPYARALARERQRSTRAPQPWSPMPKPMLPVIR